MNALESKTDFKELDLPGCLLDELFDIPVGQDHRRLSKANTDTDIFASTMKRLSYMSLDNISLGSPTLSVDGKFKWSSLPEAYEKLNSGRRRKSSLGQIVEQLPLFESSKTKLDSYSSRNRGSISRSCHDLIEECSDTSQHARLPRTRKPSLASLVNSLQWCPSEKSLTYSLPPWIEKKLGDSIKKNGYMEDMNDTEYGSIPEDIEYEDFKPIERSQSATKFKDNNSSVGSASFTIRRSNSSPCNNFVRNGSLNKKNAAQRLASAPRSRPLSPALKGKFGRKNNKFVTISEEQRRAEHSSRQSRVQNRSDELNKLYERMAMLEQENLKHKSRLNELSKERENHQLSFLEQSPIAPTSR